MSPSRPTAVTAAALFAIILGVLCCAQGSATVALPALLQDMASDPRAVAAGQEATQAMHREMLQAQRDAAADPAQAAALDQQIAELTRSSGPELGPALEDLAGPDVAGSLMFEGISAILTNLAMVVAGFGLLRLSPWSPSLARAAAWLRIGTSILGGLIQVFVMSPVYARNLEVLVPGAAAAEGAGASPMGGLLTTQLVTSAALTTAVTCAGPVILLVLLNAPSARRAFRAEGGS